MGEGHVERWLLSDLRGDAQGAPGAIGLKLDKLGRDAFAFFRGTLPQYVRRLRPELKGPLCRAEGLISGDLHLENYGAYRTESGGLAFDLNDFDDVAWGPLCIDLRRLCASATLAALCAGRGARAGGRAAAATLEGFEAGLEGAPVAPPCVDGLLQRSARQEAAAFVAQATAGEALARRLRHSATLLPAPAPVRPALERALRDLRERCPAHRRQPAAFYRLLDAACRLAGNGSLGRRRYLALVAGVAPERGHCVLLDFKEPRHSPWGAAALLLGERARALQVERAARALRAESEWVLGTARLEGRLFQVKEHSPHGMKLAAAALTPEELLAYAAHCGAVLARAWRRTRQPVEALGRALGRGGRTRLLALASADVERTLSEYEQFTLGRERIAAVLGVRAA